MFDDSLSTVNIIDDTKPLKAVISNTENNGSYVAYHINVQRGFNVDNSWTVTHRYSDFAELNSQISSWGVELPFPGKKIFGNMNRAFVEDRKKGLQTYLDVLLQNLALAETLIVKKFLDPKNYDDSFNEEALRQTSMLLRTEPHWNMVEPLKDIGARIKKGFFLVNCETEVVGKQVLTWSEIGPYYSFSAKEMTSITKLLTTIQHPYITPMTMAAFNQNGAHVSRPFHVNGSLRDYLCGAKVKGSYIKKYLSKRRTLNEQEMATAGRHILEALVFLQDRGLPYGQLHTGNVMVDTTSNGNFYKISDIENFLLGLPSRYRNLHVMHGKIKTTLDADVYNFGVLLFEAATGTELQTPTTDMIPATVPGPVRTILEGIITSIPLKDGLPTLDELIADIFFTPTSSATHVQPVLKLSTKHKQAISIANSLYETTLSNDHKSLNTVRRQANVAQKTEKRKRSKKLGRENSVNSTKNNSVSMPIGSDRSAASTPKASSVPPAPPAPPPPVPVPAASAAPPPPAGGGSGNAALLSSICSFSSNKLKKVETSDRSAPKL